MTTLQQVLCMSTERIGLRSEVVGWSYEDPSCYRGEPVGRNRSWSGPSPNYPHVLAALADGWRLLAPPDVSNPKEIEWWLVRDVEVDASRPVLRLT